MPEALVSASVPIFYNHVQQWSCDMLFQRKKGAHSKYSCFSNSVLSWNQSGAKMKFSKHFLDDVIVTGNDQKLFWMLHFSYIYCSSHGKVKKQMPRVSLSRIRLFISQFFTHGKRYKFIIVLRIFRSISPKSSAFVLFTVLCISKYH